MCLFFCSGKTYLTCILMNNRTKIAPCACEYFGIVRVRGLSFTFA